MKRLTFFMAAGMFSPLLMAQTFVGVIYPENDLTLSLGSSGPVQTVNIEQGSLVKRGETMIELMSDKERLELQRRELVWKSRDELNTLNQRLNIMQEQYRSAKSLYDETQSIAKDDLQRLEMELISIEGKIQQLLVQEDREEIEFRMAKEERQDKLLKAPISGVITQVTIQKGEWAKAGEPVIQLVDISKVYIKLNVPDAVARRLQVAQEVQANLEGAGQFDAKIHYISPIADTASGLVEVKLMIANEESRIRPGTKASVEL